MQNSRIACANAAISADEAKTLGIRTYLMKPIEKDKLLDAVHLALGCAMHAE